MTSDRPTGIDDVALSDGFPAGVAGGAGVTSPPGPRVSGIDHVLLSIPRGGEDRARAFYGGLLGLREVPKPPPLDTHGGCWFTAPGVDIHLGVEEPFAPARKAHVALHVPDLAALRSALEAAGADVRDDRQAIGVRRFYAHDPFGNRLELVDVLDGGFSNRSTPDRRGGG